MSGPKLSAAEIERRRQEELERERIEALKRLREAQQAYKQACDKAADTKRYALSLLNQIDVMYAGDAKKEMDAILSSLIIQSVSDDKNPQAYHTMADSINKDIDRVISDIDSCLSKFISRTKTDQKLAESDALHQSFQAFMNSKTDPVDVTTIDFQSNYDQQQLLDKIKQVLMHYKWLAMYGKTEAERQFALKSEDAIQKNIIDKQNVMKRQDMLSYVQAIINEEADIRRQEAEKQALYDDYVAIATLMDIIPKPPAAFANAQAIKKDIADLNSKLRKKDEMDYIADQINDAMVSLGYGFVTSRVLTRKDQSEMDCSLYQADDKTGIAIYTDQTGAVMMRMTVLGSDSDITDDDRDFSLQRQIDFCAGHADIVEALAERGIYLKQKSYLEPDKKHTYKVNMSTTGSDAQKDANGQTVLRKDKIDRRKRRRAKKKKVRAM